MRLWIFNHYAETPEGSATRTFELAKGLARRSHDITIFACSFSHYRLREERFEKPWQLFKTEDLQGVRFIWLHGFGYRKNDWRRVLNMLGFGLLAVIRGITATPKPQVIIGCSVHPCAALAALLIARLRGARFLVEVTDLWPQVLIDFGRIREWGLTARMLRFIEKLLYNQAAKIIMLWRNTDSYVRSRGIPVDKLVWIPHVVDPTACPAYRLQPQEQRQRTFKVMYLGSFVQSTALDVILDAALILSRTERELIRIILVGGGVDRNRIIARAQALGLKNVEIRGPVPKRQVMEVMEEADCFVCCIKRSPVYKYGLSMNKLCDYLMSGKPIVFSGDSAYDPVAEAGAGISVSGEDPAALATAIIQMFSLSLVQRQEMGRRGLEWVRKYHHVDVLTDRLEAVVTSSPAPEGSAA